MRFRFVCFLFFCVSSLAFQVPQVLSADAIDIGSRRELFADSFLIGKLAGEAKQVLHRPEPKEVVLVTGKPWEGNVSAYLRSCRMAMNIAHTIEVRIMTQ